MATTVRLYHVAWSIISDPSQRTKNLDEEYTKLIQEASQLAKTKAQESSFQRKLNDAGTYFQSTIAYPDKH